MKKTKNPAPRRPATMCLYGFFVQSRKRMLETEQLVNSPGLVLGSAVLWSLYAICIVYALNAALHWQLQYRTILLLELIMGLAKIAVVSTALYAVFAFVASLLKKGLNAITALSLNVATGAVIIACAFVAAGVWIAKPHGLETVLVAISLVVGLLTIAFVAAFRAILLQESYLRSLRIAIGRYFVFFPAMPFVRFFDLWILNRSAISAAPDAA